MYLLLLFCIVSTNSVAFAPIENLKLSDLGDTLIDTVMISESQDTDELVETTKNIAKDKPLIVKEVSNCFWNVLMIATLQKLQNLSNPDKYINYIKNPCLNILAITEELEPLKTIKIPGQPSFFTMRGDDIFEIQTFSQKIIPFSKKLENKFDFNGAKIRLLNNPGEWSRIYIPFLQSQLNFTISEVEFKGYGYLANGSWTGSIGQLINNEIDVCMSDIILGF